ncbi:MAG: hypothetical protein L6R42_007533, partial [Xanthoria sp. 1 TBL-2021]
VKVLLRLRRYPEAKTIIQKLEGMEPRLTREGKKLRLTILKLQAECSREQGRFQCDFEELDLSHKLWQKLLDELRKEEDSPYDAVDRAERIEDAGKNLADTKLILVEKARYRKNTPKNFDAAILCSSVFDFHMQYLEEKRSQYANQARENLDHMKIIDAERELYIANLRIGIWEGDEDKVEDAVGSLKDTLAKYERTGLGIRHQGTRNSAYRCQEGLGFLICHGAAQYKEDLHLLTEKYELLEYQFRDPRDEPYGQSSTAAWRELTRPEGFRMNPLESTDQEYGGQGEAAESSDDQSRVSRVGDGGEAGDEGECEAEGDDAGASSAEYCGEPGSEGECEAEGDDAGASSAEDRGESGGDE